MINITNPVDVTSFDVYYHSLVKLSDNRYACIYVKNSDGTTKGRVLTISGNSISIGAENNLAGLTLTGACSLGTDKFVMNVSAYYDYSDLYYFTVSGDTFTQSAYLRWSNYPYGKSKLIKIDTDRFINLVYLDKNNPGKNLAVYGVYTIVGGNTISWSGTVDWYKGQSVQLVQEYDVLLLATNKVLVYWNNPANSWKSSYSVLTISGSTITEQTTGYIYNGQCSGLGVKMYDTNKLLATYRKYSGTNYGKFGTVSGNTVTWEAEFELPINASSTPHKNGFLTIQYFGDTKNTSLIDYEEKIYSISPSGTTRFVKDISSLGGSVNYTDIVQIDEKRALMCFTQTLSTPYKAQVVIISTKPKGSSILTNFLN